MRSSPRRHCGFSLLELLLVMTLIAALLGGIGLALSACGGGGPALQSAQVMAISVVARAQQQAKLQQARTRLVLWASRTGANASDNYLRRLQVVREEPLGSDRWTATEASTFLPKPILVVPPTILPEQLPEGKTWPTGPHAPLSVLQGPQNLSVDGQLIEQAYFLEFYPDSRNEPVDAQLLLSLGVAAPGMLDRFENPAAVRGLRLRRTGVITQVNDANEL